MLFAPFSGYKQHMNDELFLDLDADAGEDIRIRFNGVEYIIVEPNLIQWDAIGKSLQKMSGLGSLVSETVGTIVGDESSDESVLSRLLQNADTLFSKLMETMGRDFFDGMSDACVAVLMTKENVQAYLSSLPEEAQQAVDNAHQHTKSHVWKGNTAFAGAIREQLNLRIASGILRAAWKRSGVLDAMGKLLMSQSTEQETEEVTPED